MDKHDGDAPADLLRRSLLREQGAAHGPQPRVAAARGGRPRRRPVVGARLPAQVRSLAQPRRRAASCSARTPRPGRCPTCRCWTRHGSGSATRRRPGASAGTRPPSPPNASSMARVVDDLIAADDDDDGVGLVTMLRARGPAGRPGRRDRTARRRPGPARRPVRAHRRGRGAGADRRGVADAAAALPVPELHHRRGPGPGQARVHRVVAGTARAGRARPDQPGLPEHQLPDAGGGHGGGRAGHPGRAPGRQRADLHPQQRRPRRPRIRRRIWARSSTPGSPRTPTGSPASSAIPTFRATSRVRSLTPELSKGLEFDLVVLVDPEAFGDGIEGAVDRYVAMTRATQQPGSPPLMGSRWTSTPLEVVRWPT